MEPLRIHVGAGGGTFAVKGLAIAVGEVWKNVIFCVWT